MRPNPAVKRSILVSLGCAYEIIDISIETNPDRSHHFRVYNSTSRLVISGQYCLDAAVQTSNGTIFNNTVYMNTCDSSSPSQQWYYEANTNHLRHLSFTSTITSSDLISVAAGCPTLTTMEACMGSQDGRNETYDNDKNFNGQPCRWCCGNECDDNGNKCAP